MSPRAALAIIAAALALAAPAPASACGACGTDEVHGLGHTDYPAFELAAPPARGTAAHPGKRHHGRPQRGPRAAARHQAYNPTDG